MVFDIVSGSTLVLGDALEYTKEIEDDSIDLLILDPPYNTTTQQWDKIDPITSEFVNELYRVLKSTGSIYIWCGIGEKSQSLIRWFPLFANTFTFKDLVTWKKRRGIGGRRGWLYTREELMWFVKDNKQFIWNKDAQYTNEPNAFKVGMSGTQVHPFKRITNVWTDIPEVLGAKKINHYTPKPLVALERIILAHTSKGDFIYDPFVGSGSTLVACIKLGRRGIGVDNDPNAIQEAYRRLNTDIGQ